MDDDPEVCLVCGNEFIGIKAALKDKNRLCDASFAKLKGLSGKGNGKAVCDLGSGLRARHSAVPVGVGFDDR